jgi:hypothetical protein
MPLTLISEMQGSREALLSRLFDGHPELYVHPHELVIGYPEAHIWPRIDLSDTAERWFEVLFEDIVNEYNRAGYKEEKEDKETFPFVFLSSLQRKIFLNYVDSVPSITVRDIFNGYMTSYFGAWLNNQNYYGSKKFITVHTPRLGIIQENVESFFEVYPDGRFINVVREPKSWLALVKKSCPGTYADVGQALGEWNKNAEVTLWNKKKYGDCVCLIRYEDIIRQTEAVMRFLAEFLAIEFDDILLTPTFNKFPIKQDTTFNTDSHGLMSSSTAEERTLTGQELNTIENVTNEKYALVRRETVRFE